MLVATNFGMEMQNFSFKFQFFCVCRIKFEFADSKKKFADCNYDNFKLRTEANKSQLIDVQSLLFSGLLEIISARKFVVDFQLAISNQESKLNFAFHFSFYSTTQTKKQCVSPFPIIIHFPTKNLRFNYQCFKMN